MPHSPDDATKQRYLQTYEREHAVTMRVLRAFPPDKLDLRPHPRCKSARELAWIFVMERHLGIALYNNVFASGYTPGTPPAPPESWEDLLAALDKAHSEFGALIRSASAEDLAVPVRFFVAPKTMAT